MTPSKILVAGPDPEVAQMLRQELAGRGFEISSAATEDEIVERLSASQPDVMVVELKLPGSAAFRFLDRYKELSPATRILVVAPSADRDDLIHLLQARAFAFFHKPVSAVSLVDMVCEAAECATCEDDIEIVSAVSHWVALRIASRLTTVDRVVQFYRELETDLAPAEREHMATALREVLMNAVEHGARCDPRSKVTVTRLRTANFVGFYIRDPGDGFSFDDLSHAAVSNPAESVTDHMNVREERGMRPGGFGIAMARSLLDGLYYNEKGNEVILVKNIHTPKNPV